jgi:hypothetical protein
MSKRSKHGRGKHPHFRKKGKFKYMEPGAGVTQASAGVIQPATGGMPMTTAPTGAAPSVTAPAQQAPWQPVQKRPASSVAQSPHYEHIGSELRRIGILTCSIVVILIVLYMFLK